MPCKCRTCESKEPKHIPEYFIDGNKAEVSVGAFAPKASAKVRVSPAIPDATGFPFDDNTAGEELELAGPPNIVDVIEQLLDSGGDLRGWIRAQRELGPKATLGGHPDFYKILDEMKSLYSAKHYQYATDKDPMANFRLCGDLIHKMLKPGIRPTIAAALCLMSKQIVGVYEIVGEGKTNTIESLQDKLRDIGIYSVILQILVAETQEQK